VPIDLLNRAVGRFERVGIWLDRDKAREAAKTAFRAISIGLPVFTIYSEKDPKEYSDKEILELVELSSNKDA
jgi:hypothetical protein